jgi:dihydroflavonol-4-reductase
MSEQVLITGISGFAAKHIALNLLQKGYSVRGTLRTPTR